MSKVNETIKVLYQASGGDAGLTVTMEIFDETGYKDEINFPDVVMEEVPIAGSSMYVANFTPDVKGNWAVHCFLPDGVGSTIKSYLVSEFDIDDIPASGDVTSPTTIT